MEKSDISPEIVWWVRWSNGLQQHTELNLSLLHVETGQTSQSVHVYLHHSFKPQWGVWSEFGHVKRETDLWWRWGRLPNCKGRLLIFATVLFTVGSSVSAPLIGLPSLEIIEDFNCYLCTLLQLAPVTSQILVKIWKWLVDFRQKQWFIIEWPMKMNIVIDVSHLSTQIRLNLAIMESKLKSNS